MVREAASDNIDDAAEGTSWADRDLVGSGFDVGGNVGRVPGGNFGMMGYLGGVRRTLVLLVHSYVGIGVDTSMDDHLFEVGGMGIGMALDYDCRKHNAGVGVGRMKALGAHMTVVDSP
jgi:hypothetical protein